jgi:adenosylcobinamide-phosphate guanylyltransferase
VDALIMCGGEGTRLDADVEKPLFEIGGVAMVELVADALAQSAVESVTAAVSGHTPDTRARLADRDGVRIVDTPGNGYVEDLDDALDAVETPVLTVVADLPLLDATVVDRVLAAARSAPGALSVSVPAALKRALGASVDIEQAGLAPTGCNVVTERTNETPETMYTSYDARLAVNVNRRSDAQLAETLWRDPTTTEQPCE